MKIKTKKDFTQIRPIRELSPEGYREYKQFEHGLHYPLADILDAYCEIFNMTREDILKKRIFKNQIFMGAGGQNLGSDHTSIEMGMIYHKIDQALICISGMQQNGGMGHTFDVQSDKEDRKILESITRDIVMALMGEEVKFLAPKRKASPKKRKASKSKKAK